MKRLYFALAFFFAVLSCAGQELEFCTSLNTSSEPRLQNAAGFGLRCQHSIGKKILAGLGIHYNFRNSGFDEVRYIDGDPDLLVVDRIKSDSYRLSLRLNLQAIMINNNNASLTFGPEISYNYLWGKDNVDEITGQMSNQYNYSQNNGPSRDFGFGLISEFEIKNIIARQLSLCFTIRPELLIGKDLFLKGGEPIFSGGLGFTEIQVGLKYRFKNQNAGNNKNKRLIQPDSRRLAEAEK